MCVKRIQAMIDKTFHKCDVLKCKLKRHDCKICVDEFSILSAYIVNFLLVKSETRV